MATNYTDCHVKCPFYHHQDSTKLVCEGIIEDNESVTLRYRTRRDKERYRKEFCEDDYESCKLHAVILDKY